MSKFRNRSIRILPSHLLDNYNKSALGTLKFKEKEDYFGENIYTKESNSTLSSCDECLEAFILGGDKNNRDISSASSLSWSDFEGENAGSKVYEELRKIDRALKGIESVPEYYDRDEFDQWMDTFPNLSIFDDNEETKQDDYEIKKIVLSNSKSKLYVDCDKLNTSSVSEATPNKKRFSNNKNIFTMTHAPQQLDVNEFLKISPIKHTLHDRRQSNKSLLQPKQVFEDVDEFISLPFLNEENTRRNIYSSSSHRIKPEVRKKQHHLVLPPIVSQNQFRSISATPRKPVKSNYGKKDNIKDMSDYLINHSFGKKSHLLL